MHANTRFFFKLSAAYINRFRLIITAGIFIGISLFFFFSLFSSKLFRNVDRIGITGRFTSDNLPNEILLKISSGLTKYSEDGIPISSLASSWDITDKGKTWTFHLKDNIYWQDGKKVIADSINYNFSDVKIEKTDSRTIVFKLNDIFVPFPSILSAPVFKKGLLGTGEWKVENIKFSGSIVTELSLVNENGQKNIFKFYPTYKRTVNAFKLGQVNKITNVLDKSPFDKWTNVNIVTIPNKHQIVTIFFNNEDKYLGDKSLRQALTYAINKNILGIRAISPISPESWAFNAQVKAYDYDINRAKELLGDLSKEKRSEMKIKLTTSPDLLSVAETISKDWTAVGVDNNVQISPVIPTDFQAFLTILDVPVEPDQYTLWHSTQTNSNVANYRNPRVDKLLEDGRTQLNIDERKKLYLDFQRFLLEDLPAAFLYYPSYYEIYRN